MIMGMDAELKRINKAVSDYDRDLYAIRNSYGVIYIFRQGKCIHDSMVPSDIHIDDIPRSSPQFLLALTDNLQTSGKPVSWGLLPLMEQIKSMDVWKRGESAESFHTRMIEARDRRKEEEKRQRINTFRAAAADSRRDIAEATNEIVFRR